MDVDQEVTPEQIERITGPGDMIPLPARRITKAGDVGIHGGLAEMPTPAMVKRGAELIVAQMEAMHVVRIAALRCTSESDWTAHGLKGDPPSEWKPYLMGCGCLKLYVPLKILFNRDPQPQFVIYNEGKQSEFYAVFFYGTAIALNLSSDIHVEAIGTRTSKDPFFTKRGKIEADPGNVVKAAATNWAGNAVRKVAGLEAPPWKLLEEAGLDVKLIQKRAGVTGAGQMQGDAAVARGQQSRAAASIDRPMLAVDIGYFPNDPKWNERKQALKAAGARFKVDNVTDKWFLDDTPTTRSFISKMNLIGQTDEVKPNGNGG